MNESIAEREAQWDTFLQRWPLESLASMTLPQYSQAGDQDCFVYWLEAKTENLGSIWGGSAFKFGVYSRKDQSDKEAGPGISYSAQYGWYSKYGSTAEEAFEQVHAIVVEIANAARVGDLDVIQRANLGHVVKWKIAFLYQNRAQPLIVPIYGLRHLRAAVRLENNKLSHAELYRHLIKDRAGNSSIIEYGIQLWERAVAIKESEQSNLSAREKIAKHFTSHPVFKEYWEEEWQPEIRELFIDYANAIHEAGLDWWFVNGNWWLRYGRKTPSDKNGIIAGHLNPKKSGIDVSWKAIGDNESKEMPLSQESIDFWQSDDVLTLLNDLYPSGRDGLWPDDYSNEPVMANAEKQIMNSNTNLNTILYGPPGTGKTFSTIDETLKIIDPIFFNENAGNRSLLKARFDELVTAEQVRFVTFHQSFSYEDFVEGLRAETDDETKQISYNVEDGIFKQICLDARRPITSNVSLGVSEKPRIWKISIDGTNSSETRKYCYANDEARIGWGYAGDLRKTDLNDPSLKLGPNDRSSLRNFSQDIQPGDILLCIASNSEVGGVGVVQSEYSYDAKPPEGVMDDYKHVLKVKWVLKGIRFSILPHNNQVLFTLKTVYELRRFNWTELALALEKSGHTLPMFNTASKMQESEKPHVLIIDEINRGNISRIFGELITLIEPSKRAGKDEALEVTLPYSKKPFSVPSNLYLIGTMNTADRSLAGLDIALRRRFTFKEMPPRPELLDGVTIDGVDLGELLRAMNARIEVLLDADHCLGHAYFMPLKENKTLDKLAFIFRQQVLPLLQEYFFEDWQRIAWVLNDQRKPSNLAFVQEPSADLASLFGNETKGNLQDRRWRINEEAFSNIESYRRILGVMA